MHSAHSSLSSTSLTHSLGRFKGITHRGGPDERVNIEIRPRNTFDLVIPVQGKMYKVVKEAEHHTRTRPNFSALIRTLDQTQKKINDRKFLVRPIDDDMFGGLLSKKPRVD